MSSQAGLSEFHTAFEIGRKSISSDLSENTLLDIIRSFQNNKRLNHFLEDVQNVLAESGDSLNDVEKLRESARELNALIKQLSTLSGDMLTRANDIIDKKQKAGVTQEGFFEIYPITRIENRKPDMEKIKRHEKEWNKLIDFKKSALETSYTPTQTDLKTFFGKQFKAFLIPGQEVVTGYDIRPVMPEKAAEVEL